MLYFCTSLGTFSIRCLLLLTQGAIAIGTFMNVTDEVTLPALLHEEGLRKGEEMVSFDYHTKNCHETSISHPQLV
jgi:hypothetical protein